MKSECIVYKGIIFRRYPESKRRSDRVYYTCNSKYYKQGIRRLHQEIWKDAHGEIPENHHVHHKDGNTLNNSIDNLECIPHAIHVRHHIQEWASEHQEELKARGKERMKTLQEWYKTEEGLAQRRENAKYLWSVKHKHTCICCGKEYESHMKTGRFCSSKCAAKYRRDSGVDNEKRTCLACGNDFFVNKYSDSRCCSKKCAWVVRLGNVDRHDKTQEDAYA